MKKPSHKRVSRYDVNALLQAIIATVAANTYATPHLFRTAVEGVVQAYLRGAGRYFALSATVEIISRIDEYAKGNADKGARWWTDWVARSASQSRESNPAPRRGRRGLPISLRSSTYMITPDSDLVATGIAQEVAVISDRNRFQLYSSPAEARDFAIGFLNALNKLEAEQDLIEIELIPPDYSEAALADWDEDVRWGNIKEDDQQDENDQGH